MAVPKQCSDPSGRDGVRPVPTPTDIGSASWAPFVRLLLQKQSAPPSHLDRTLTHTHTKAGPVVTDPA